MSRLEELLSMSRANGLDIEQVKNDVLNYAIAINASSEGIADKMLRIIEQDRQRNRELRQG